MRLLRLLPLLFALTLASAAGAAEPAAEQGHGEAQAAHGEGHGEAHDFSLKDINWFYGMLGEKADVPPSVLWRPKGMPAPFGALLVNAALLYLILFRMLGQPILQSLKSRKEGILRGMEESARMRKEARARLREYEDKLDHIDDEIERVRREMREAGEAERVRILADAKERRARMERDARLLIDQELKAAREELLRETAKSAVASAATTLLSRITPSDQQRLADEYLASVKQSAAGLRGRV